MIVMRIIALLIMIMRMVMIMIITRYLKTDYESTDLYSFAPALVHDLLTES